MGFLSRIRRIGRFREPCTDRTTAHNGVVHYDLMAEGIRKTRSAERRGIIYVLDEGNLQIITSFTNVTLKLNRYFNKRETDIILNALRYLTELGLISTPLIPLRKNGTERNGKQKKQKACLLCRRKNSITAHHTVPKSLGGDDSPANIVTLCRPCHDAVESVIAEMERASLTQRVTLFYVDYVGILLAAKIRL